MNTYHLGSPFLDGSYEITENEFSYLQNSRDILLKALEIESSYDQVIETYIDLKHQFYKVSINDSVRHHFNFEDIQIYEIKSKVNRLLKTLLSLSKFYLDKSYHAKTNNSWIKRISNDDSLHEKVKILAEDLYDNNLLYRVTLTIRNLTQHELEPLTTLSVGFSVADVPKSIATFTCKKESLQSRIPTEMYNELSKELDLHRFIDGYISAVSEIHHLNRQCLLDLVTKSRTAFQQKITEAHEAIRSPNIYAYKNSNREFPLFLEWFDIYYYLLKKNDKRVTSSKSYHYTYGD